MNGQLLFRGCLSRRPHILVPTKFLNNSNSNKFTSLIPQRNFVINNHESKLLLKCGIRTTMERLAIAKLSQFNNSNFLTRPKSNFLTTQIRYIYKRTYPFGHQKGVFEYGVFSKLIHFALYFLFFWKFLDWEYIYYMIFPMWFTEPWEKYIWHPFWSRLRKVLGAPDED